MWEQIEQVLDAHVRPYLREHGGDLKLVRVEGNTVYVRLLGQCAACSSAYDTVGEVVETALQAHIPSIRQVLLEPYDMEFYQYAKQLLHCETQKANL